MAKIQPFHGHARTIPRERVRRSRVLDTHGFDRADEICDAEGAEIDLIEQEAEVLRTRIRNLVVEMHGYMVGQDAVGRAETWLAKLGFVVEGASDNTFFYRNMSIR